MSPNTSRPDQAERQGARWLASLAEAVRRNLTYNQQRMVAVAVVLVATTTLANELLDWNLFGLNPKALRSVVVLIGFLVLLIVGPGLLDESERREARRKLLEEEYEASLVRDAVEDDKLRRDIGMTPNKPLQRTGKD